VFVIVPVQIRHWFVSSLSLGLGTAIFTANASSFAQPKSETKAACVTAYKEGQVHRKNGELLSARDDFKVCAQNVCPVVLRKDCGPWLQKVEESIPSIVVNPSSATGKPLSDSRILVDGKAVEPKSPDGTIEMDPGAHVVRVEATGHNAVDRSIKLRTGEKKTILEIKLEPTKAAPKTGSRPIPGSFSPCSARERKPCSSAENICAVRPLFVWMRDSISSTLAFIPPVTSVLAEPLIPLRIAS